MKFPWQRTGHHDADPDVERRIEEAEREVAELKVRAERAADALLGRYARNHWGETATAIARGQRREHP